MHWDQTQNVRLVIGIWFTINTTVANYRVGTAILSGAPVFIPDYQWDCLVQPLVVYVVFCRLLSFSLDFLIVCPMYGFRLPL